MLNLLNYKNLERLFDNMYFKGIHIIRNDDKDYNACGNRNAERNSIFCHKR